MPTPTATIFLPYHALDDVIQRGTRAAQPAASAVVPGTLYCVTDESYRLERSDGSAWALAAPTGGGSGGGTPDPHHVTHEPGGSDALVDAAWTDVSNIFAADQTIDGDLFVTGTVNPLTDAQRDQINALIGDPTGARTLMSSSFISGLSLRHDEAVARGRIACGNYDTQTYQPLAFEVEALEVHTGVSPAARVEHVRVHPLGGVTVGDAAEHASDPGLGILRARGLDGTPLDATQLLSGTVPVARLGAGTTTVVDRTDTGTVHDWAPGLAGNTYLTWHAASDLTITGIAGGVSGQVLTIRNVGGGGTIYLAHYSASSAIPNRVLNNLETALTPVAGKGTITYCYDGLNSRWTLIQHEQGTWITPPYSAANFTASGSMTWTVEAGDIVSYKYYVKGLTVSVQVRIVGSSVGGTLSTALVVVLPNGLTNKSALMMMVRNEDNGVSVIGLLYMPANVTTLNFYRDISAGLSWAASTNQTGIDAVITFEVKP